jgi:hypothetical protein
MSKTNVMVRRSSAALMVALSMLLVAGTSAHATENFESGGADAQALHLVLSIPSSDALKATLAQIGVPTDAIPTGLFKSQTLVIDVSSDHGALTVSGSQGSSTALAYSLTDGSGKDTLDSIPVAGAAVKGLLPTNVSTSSSCKWDVLTHAITSCASGDPVAAQSITIPNGLGTIEIAGARSTSATPLSTDNASSLVKIHLDLRPLFGTASALAEPVKTATDTVNASVVPAVNTALKTVEDTVKPNDFVPGLTFSTMKNLPSIATVPLLDLTVLPGGASVNAGPGAKKVTASATSEIVDLSVLGGWLNLKAVEAKADASYSVPTLPDLDASAKAIAKLAATDYKGAQAQLAAINKAIRAAGPAKPDANRSLDVGGGTVGGIANLDLAKVIDNFNGAAPIVKRVLATPALASVHDAIAPAANELVAAATLADQISGISIGRNFGSKFHKDGKVGTLLTMTNKNNRIRVEVPSQGEPDKEVLAASAVSDQLTLDVAPKLPKLSALTAVPSAAGIVPRLGKSDFVPSGVTLHVDMPKAAAHLGNGNVLALGVARARTGVGTHAFAALLLIGAAIVVKKYALTK